MSSVPLVPVISASGNIGIGEDSVISATMVALGLTKTQYFQLLVRTLGVSGDSVISAPGTRETGSSQMTGTGESLTESRGLVPAL